jgi:hypothetical protein
VPGDVAVGVDAVEKAVCMLFLALKLLLPRWEAHWDSTKTRQLSGITRNFSRLSRLSGSLSGFSSLVNPLGCLSEKNPRI